MNVVRARGPHVMNKKLRPTMQNCERSCRRSFGY